MNFYIKKSIKRIVSPLLLHKKNIRWKTDLLHTLVKCLPGYFKKDWLKAFNNISPEWQKYVEVQFFDNFAVRDRLIPTADIYIDTCFSGKLLRQAPQIKLVQIISSGVEFLEDISNTDKVLITTAAGISARGVAEHTLMLMLALDRRLDLSIARQKFGRWCQKGILQNIRGIKDRVVGIVGLGNNGRAVASLAMSVGMKVIGIDIRSKLSFEGVKICSFLPELLGMSDFVVLCVPLTASTHKMIGLKELKQMKRDACLINVSRGQVIDESALAFALRKGIIAGAALDVLSSEPPPLFHPLRFCPNLIITPHIAGNIYTYRNAIMARFVSNIMAFINRKPLDGLYRQEI